jgi:hypothetical protein
MQMTFGQRFVRFMLMPISLLGCVMVLNFSPTFIDIANLCTHREECYAHCNKDNFPLLTCDRTDFELTYNGNFYNRLFVYKDPTQSNSVFASLAPEQ